MKLNFRREYGQLVTSGAQLLLLFVGARFESRVGWIVCVSLIAALSVVGWVAALNRRRAIADTPTSRIASAAQGYVELCGRGKGLDFPPLLSHLTALPCLWYRYQVEEKTSGGKWHIVSHGESEVAFIIDDGSGRCVVDVEGAEIVTRHKETWTRGGKRNTEWKLLIDDAVYALGDFKTLGGNTLELDANADIGDLLSEWKKNPRQLLKRFDLNTDGSIDMKEWMLARQAARRDVAKAHREARDEADVHTLRRPANGALYLLSNFNPEKLARRYLWWSLFHITVFFGALGTLPWIIQQHF